jgi:hypothetical protein
MAKYTCERNHPSQNEPKKIHISWWNKVSPNSMVGPSNDELPNTGPSKKKPAPTSAKDGGMRLRRTVF